MNCLRAPFIAAVLARMTYNNLDLILFIGFYADAGGNYSRMEFVYLVDCQAMAYQTAKCFFLMLRRFHLGENWLDFDWHRFCGYPGQQV